NRFTRRRERPFSFVKAGGRGEHYDVFSLNWEQEKIIGTIEDVKILNKPFNEVVVILLKEHEGKEFYDETSFEAYMRI
ncbi:MAG: hypothetical protein QMD03_07320, partial [Syntrophales bacterium]|nr:hypothetical protein [Syntrophales bacterium]